MYRYIHLNIEVTSVCCLQTLGVWQNVPIKFFRLVILVQVWKLTFFQYKSNKPVTNGILWSDKNFTSSYTVKLFLDKTYAI